MTRFIVFEPPAADAADAVTSDRARFVRDGFAGWAVLFPFLWLFRHGLVVAGLAVLALWIGFGVLGDSPGLGLAAGVLPILLGLLVALEGPSLRAASFRRRAFREAAVVEAEDEAEAEILYYYAGAQGSAGAPAAARAPAGHRPPAARRTASLLDPPRAIR